MPNSTRYSNYLCQYCRWPAPKVCYPTEDDGEPEFVDVPKVGALLPNIPMTNRVPDVLHMVKNCTEFLLDRTCREIYSGRTLNPKTRKDWINEQVKTHLKKARKYSSYRPQSTDTAYWEYSKSYFCL